MAELTSFFATCARGIEPQLAKELAALGNFAVKETGGGVSFEAQMADAYKVCLWTRLANRVLLLCDSGPVGSTEDIYSRVYRIPWEEYFDVDLSIFIDFLGTNSVVKNTMFGAQLVKDAVVDRFNQTLGRRPSVDKNDPSIRIYVHLKKDKATISIDISGESLHKRGYRVAQGEAPLKENLAAALLTRAGWPDTGPLLVDPMCGSATFLIEAAMMKMHVAPGLSRKKFGFENLNCFDANEWQEIVREAINAERPETQSEIFGYDSDPAAVDAARQNIEAAGLSQCISVTLGAIDDVNFDYGSQGLIICNPPYGERLGRGSELEALYEILGEKVKKYFAGWNFAVFTGNAELSKRILLKPDKKYQYFNGAIASQLLLYQVFDHEKRAELSESTMSEGAIMVSNRIKKNLKRLAKWRNENGISCYRVYDADIPEYSAAIDIYEGAIAIQEYQAPKNIDVNKAKQRFSDLIDGCKYALNSDNVFIKLRKVNRGPGQYQKNSDEKKIIEVTEGKIKCLVNLSDYLDVGLFLDHRLLRLEIANQAPGKSFLNLFCYTATASVHAAIGGAKSSVSVDMSNTYIGWAQDNFSLNNVSRSEHQLVRADCIDWLQNCRQGFDLIMLDPPSFSNSKSLDRDFDVQKDHQKLIKRCMEILNPHGILYFSTNLRSFKLDSELENIFNVTDISLSTIDRDFERNKKIHYCWKITA